MGSSRSRLDDLSNIILSVANKNGGELNLERLPDSRLPLPEEYLADIPAVFSGDGADSSLVCGLDYFAPGMRALVLGGRSHLLAYLAARAVGSSGEVLCCSADRESLGELQDKFAASANGPLADVSCHYTPKGDLRLRYEEVERYLADRTVDKLDGYLELEQHVEELKRENPLVADNSIDIVALDGPGFDLSAGVFWTLAAEVYRVLKKDGIFLFSLVVSDEKASAAGYVCEADLGLLTGTHKFYGLTWLGRGDLPLRVVQGRELRYFNFVAFKGKEGPCMERKQAVVYNGPWREVRDDDGHVFPRGRRVAVCDKTYNIMKNAPYRGRFTYIDPYIDIPLDQASPFPCSAGILYRDPLESKGVVDKGSAAAGDCCAPAEAGDADDCGCEPADIGSCC